MKKCILISDFTIDNFASILKNDKDTPAIDSYTAPFGQVIPVLIDSKHEVWNQEYDFAVIWTKPERVINSFNSLLEYKNIDIDTIIAEVDEYLGAINSMSGRVRNIFIPTWSIPMYNRGFGMLDMKSDFGITSILMKMNLRIADFFKSSSNIFILDSQKWIAPFGERAYNPKLWYMGKIPFSKSVFSEAAQDLKAALNGIEGLAKKLIILDLDDTLWGGIVGDDGWENLNLGGHNAIGESFVDFQKELKSLTNRGILLAIVSKNEESIALEAIGKHPEMVLREDDFAGWKINWNDKARNIVELVQELNLGLQSVVFLDDNPAERQRVKDALPEVYVPDLPKDKMRYVSTLINLRCFDSPSFSNEDQQRAQMYAAERKRKELKVSVGSVDEWIRSLETKIKIEPLTSSFIDRTCQLINKTNQMNLSTRRMTTSELIEWEGSEGNNLWTLRVSDKLGDSGLTGIISFKVVEKKAEVVDFILSCRVMGRRIEEIMVSHVVDKAKSLGISDITAVYLPTKKNKPCFDFWKRSGFDYDESTNIFSWSLDKEYPIHDLVEVELVDVSQ